MKKIYAATVLLIHLLLLGVNSPYPAQGQSSVKMVVIDAGHGGHDPGAIGITGVKEKDIALTIALKLGAMIEKNTDVKVIYTRKTDVFVELHQRAQLANANHADIFISIHCNSVENNSTARGTETYVMGLNKSQENLAIAQKENAAILTEKNYEDNYGGFDPTSPEAYIMFSLYQNAYLKQSISLAAAIQTEFKTVCKLQDRGVKQGALLVLWRSAMPSVLIETGFLSNKEEEHYLSSEKGQTELAQAIYNGFSKVSPPSSPKKQEVKEEITTPAKVNDQSSEVTYKIQLLALKKELKKTDPQFKKLPEVEIEKIGNIFKYFTGHCTAFSDAQKALTNVKEAGFLDAFIVAYKKDGTKVTVQEAKEIENKK